MKKLYYIPLVLGLAACSGEAPEATDAESSQTGTETNSTTPVQVNTLITKSNAASVSSYDNTPESVVQYFYASRIRGDQEWEKVCQPAGERSDRMNRKLEDYAGWTILEYKFVSKEEKKEDKCAIKLWMKIQVEGETDEGEDEAEVQLINGKWVITSIPT